MFYFENTYDEYEGQNENTKKNVFFTQPFDKLFHTICLFINKILFCFLKEILVSEPVLNSVEYKNEELSSGDNYCTNFERLVNRMLIIFTITIGLVSIGLLVLLVIV